MYNDVWGCAEILPTDAVREPFSKHTLGEEKREESKGRLLYTVLNLFQNECSAVNNHVSLRVSSHTTED